MLCARINVSDISLAGRHPYTLYDLSAEHNANKTYLRDKPPINYERKYIIKNYIKKI